MNRRYRVLATALAIAALLPLANFRSRAFAQTDPAITPAGKPLPPDPAFDARLKEYLQKTLYMKDQNGIDLGPLIPTKMPGIIARRVHVVTERGQLNVEIFTDAKREQIIVGQMYDLTTSPWKPTDLGSLHMDDRPSEGPANAPVTIVEFADFECPFCGRAFGVLETMVNTTYKGKLRLFYKYYPLNSHQWAQRAAQGAECARLQNPDDFWEMARFFYGNQGQINPKNIDDQIRDEAKRLGLDIPSLNACLAAPTTKARVAQDQADGVTVGVESTPTFFVNGIKVVGLPEEKAFDNLIQMQIQKAQELRAKQ
jgi:protein-disulfide isomerase